MIREPIYAALFAKLSELPGIKVASRTFKHFSDCAPADQPALYMVQRHESATTTPGLKTVWTLSCDLLLYAHTKGNKKIAPASVLNPLLDAVEAAFAVDNHVLNKCTLGGLVQHAWIEGTIETDEGLLGE